MPLNSPKLPIRHYLQFTDLTADEYAHLFKRAAFIKGKFKAYEKYQPLADRTMAMIFEKASTRTRVSFDIAMRQLGGSVLIGCSSSTVPPLPDRRAGAEGFALPVGPARPGCGWPR